MELNLNLLQNLRKFSSSQVTEKSSKEILKVMTQLLDDPVC